MDQLAPSKDSAHPAPAVADSSYEPCTYQLYGVMDALKDALRPLVRPGEMLMWRDAFRWKNDEGVLPNHYECFSLEGLCIDHGYEVVHDFNHVAIVKLPRNMRG